MQPLWKHRNYMLLSAGQGISWLGTEISGIAMPLIVLALTGSAALAGTIAAMRGITYVLLSLPAGYALDRGNRRNIMIISNLGSGLAMFMVFLALLFKHLSIPELFILYGIEGSCFVFANIGRFSSLRFIVPNEQLHAAIAQDSAVGQFAQMVGPSFGGFLYQTVGPMISFLADALSYVINAIALSFVNNSLSLEKKEPDEGLRKGLKEAAAWLWGQQLYRVYLCMSWIRIIVVEAVSLLVIILAKQFHASAGFIGIILAISAASGVIGSIVAGKFARKYNRFTALVVTGIISTAIFMLYFIASNLVTLTIITAILFALFPSYYIICAGIIGKIPHHIQGRVTSITRSGDFICYSLGLTLMGFTVQFLGDKWTISIFSLLLFVFLMIMISNKKLLDAIPSAV
ncbi:MFS transporter [Dictyobacter halimunensis]